MTPLEVEQKLLKAVDAAASATGGTGEKPDGMAVIKKILDDHGARVRLVNRAEGGAMVEIEFPLGDEVREGGRDG